MDQVPKEIKRLILNHCDNKTKRIARLACTEWFNIIDYNNFKLYLTKKLEWRQIVDRLSRYDKPIALKLRKNIMKSLTDINEHLTRLTNVTCLSIDNLASGEDQMENESWLKLTSALSKLQDIGVKDYEYNIPVEPLLRLNFLTSFHQPFSSDSELATTRLVQRIRSLPNLESCSISPKVYLDTPEMFDSCHSRLTFLSIYTDDVPDPVLEKWFSHLHNLKELHFTVNNPKGHTLLSLKQLTLLHTLSISGLQLGEVSSTNLTNLELFSVDEQCIEKEAPKLTNLRRLIFDFKSLDKDDSSSDTDDDASQSSDEQKHYSYKWLTALTSLDYINIDPMQYKGLAFIPTQLKALQFWVYEDGTDLTHLTRFKALRELYMTIRAVVDLSQVAKLTRLERLQIDCKPGERMDIPFSLSTLSNLTWLEMGRCPAEVSHLPYLEELSLKFSASCTYSGFDDLPSLKKFTVGHNFHEDGDYDLDYTFIPKMATLTSLVLDNRSSQAMDCKFFSTLTALEVLHIGTIADENSYDYIAGLTKLTKLWIGSGISSPKILNFPTSLQMLVLELMKPKTDIKGWGDEDEDENTEKEKNPLFQQLLERHPNLVKSAFYEE